MKKEFDIVIARTDKKIATLYSTDWTIAKPNWFVEKKKSKNDWLIFPWESKDEKPASS